MSRTLDDIINDCSKPKQDKSSIEPEVPLTDNQMVAKIKEFFFGKQLQTPHREGGECPKHLVPMRFHLSTYICDQCIAESEMK